MKFVALRHPVTRAIEYRMGVMCTHADLASAHITRGFTVRSAGFVRFTGPGKAETFGQSTGLGLVPHEEDARALTTFNAATLFEGGIEKDVAFAACHV